MGVRFPHQMPEPDDGLMATINTTPLVDVMLVLLIIFLIAVPVFSSSIAVSLPREGTQGIDEKPQDIIVTVDAQGAVYWFDTPVANTPRLAQQLAQEAVRQPQPELHIRADARADYQAIGQVVYAAQQAGIAKIGFLTEPPP
ncbi:ExbD/TolR family protein [Ramlibacter sp. PS4R-6]|uniref:ExbD/TolR family protein n=1 Tax=Ramlibacter sp. PS4R-6 TaxID=3133438 RepID=UPI003094F803